MLQTCYLVQELIWIYAGLTLGDDGVGTAVSVLAQLLGEDRNVGGGHRRHLHRLDDLALAGAEFENRLS